MQHGWRTAPEGVDRRQPRAALASAGDGHPTAMRRADKPGGDIYRAPGVCKWVYYLRRRRKFFPLRNKIMNTRADPELDVPRSRGGVEV